MYLIMHKNDVIAKANNEQITDVYVKELCPACIFVGASLERWIKSRSVDTHRSHSRQLYHVLRLNSYADYTDIIKVGHGITITDNWWIQEENEHLDYYELKEYNEEIANTAFYGFPENHDFIVKGYTELGTIGSYEKAWRFINDSWYMLKHGNKAELISEHYAYGFLNALGISVAEYQVQRKLSETGLMSEWIVSKDFTENGKYDFEPFFNYFDENEDYDYIISRLEQMNSSLAENYVEMCFYDALLFNTDRHNFNAGFLRDSDSGKVVDLAPWFDYNLSLVANKTPHFNKNNPDLMKFFVKNDNCMRIMTTLFPLKKNIIKALEYATKQTAKAFPNDNFNYQLIENYILQAFDYCDLLIEQKKQIGR